MARPRRTDVPDTTKAHDLTAGVIERLTCPKGKQQAFLRDSKAPGLRVRVTAAGAKSFVFEAKLNRQTIRRTIGDVRAWSIEQARAEANRLRVTLDDGQDPRELERQQQAEAQERKAAAKVATMTVAEAWSAYLEDRKPHWGERHHADHLKLAAAGGAPRKRGAGVTQPGPLHSLMATRLADLDSVQIEAWAEIEGNERPTVARLAWRLLRAFLTWCTEHPKYSTLVASSNPAKTKRTREALGKPGAKRDAIMREQLPAWFAAIKQLPCPAVVAYLQFQLLTGCRPSEGIAIKWVDVDFKWSTVLLRDKVEGERIIPLPAYLVHVLYALPRRNAYVFASPSVEGAHIQRPARALHHACIVAGIEPVSPHVLRRSFKSLSEWVEMPTGIVAQIMGHKPSATAEKHYTVRPLDLLRVHHEKLVAWILEQADIQFDAAAEPGKLRVVAGARQANAL